MTVTTLWLKQNQMCSWSINKWVVANLAIKSHTLKCNIMNELLKCNINLQGFVIFTATMCVLKLLIILNIRNPNLRKSCWARTTCSSTVAPIRRFRRARFLAESVELTFIVRYKQNCTIISYKYDTRIKLLCLEVSTVKVNFWNLSRQDFWSLDRDLDKKQDFRVNETVKI